MRDLVLVLSRVFFVNERFRDGELLEDRSSSTRVSTSSGTMGPFPLSRAMHHDCYLLHLFQDHDFFRSGLVVGHSCVVSARLDLTTLSSVLLFPLAFSPCSDANRGISLLVIGSSECSSLRLPRVNHT